MFKTNTVVVVGAGASAEVGLPTGPKLKDKICSLLDIRFNPGESMSGDVQVMQYISNYASRHESLRGNSNPLLHKAWQIVGTLPDAISIDNYLDAHVGDELLTYCGKIAIVRAILDAEANSRLAYVKDQPMRYDRGSLRDTWYNLFFQKLTENIPASNAHLLSHNISFIVFNYDRCIEHFLAQAIEDYYAIPRDEAQAIASHFKIIHPYGPVGRLPWKGVVGGIPFGEPYGDLELLSQGIKTFTEGRHTNERLEDVHELMRNAQTLIFLGFAFHDQNLELLKPSKGTKVEVVLGTNFGISKEDSELLNNDLVALTGNLIYPDLYQGTCYEFFQQRWRRVGSGR